MNEGAPISYLVLAEHTPVYASGGEEIGHVEKVLAVPEEDIFDGIVIKTEHGDRFLGGDQVASIHERGVDASVSATEASELPPPEANAGAIRYDYGADGEVRSWRDVLGWLSERGFGAHRRR